MNASLLVEKTLCIVALTPLRNGFKAVRNMPSMLKTLPSTTTCVIAWITHTGGPKPDNSVIVKRQHHQAAADAEHANQPHLLHTIPASLSIQFPVVDVVSALDCLYGQVSFVRQNDSKRPCIPVISVVKLSFTIVRQAHCFTRRPRYLSLWDSDAIGRSFSTQSTSRSEQLGSAEVRNALAAGLRPRNAARSR